MQNTKGGTQIAFPPVPLINMCFHAFKRLFYINGFSVMGGTQLEQ